MGFSGDLPTLKACEKKKGICFLSVQWIPFSNGKLMEVEDDILSSGKG